MKASNKIQNFVGPMLPKSSKPKALRTPRRPKALNIVPTKEEVRPSIEARIKELESELQILKKIQTETYGRPSNYKPPVNVGVGEFIRQCIKSDMRNVDILKLVEEKYVNNSTTYACVAWYRNDMKKKGLI